MSTTRPVTISTPDGIALAGVLRTPQDPVRRAGVVLTGPFTGVKEQVVATYATGLAARGYTTLAFDHRNFGASGGRPRQHEDPGGKLADLGAATTVLLQQEGVDQVGCLGVCLGAGYALRYTAFDPRITALVTVAGAYNSPRDMRDGFGAEAYRRTLRDLALVEQPGSDGMPSMPAVAREGEAAMPGDEPFEYYGTDRGGTPGWRNEVTRASIRQLLTFDAAIGADFVSPTPVRIIHGTEDAFCSPKAAQATYDRIGDPRDLHWIETTNHIDLYDRPEYVEPALDSCAAWYDEHLAVRVSS